MALFKLDYTRSQAVMTADQILEWQKTGFEVACHGSTHKNKKCDVEKCIIQLNSFGVDTKDIGFASPLSEITVKNVKEMDIYSLLKRGTISYIRSGIQVRREGMIYLSLSLIEKYTHSRKLYFKLNKRNILNMKKIPNVIPSIAVKSYHTFDQIKYFIEHMEDNNAAIIMFHSILNRANELYGVDYYCWDVEKFEQLCRYVYDARNIDVVTIKDIIDDYNMGEK